MKKVIRILFTSIGRRVELVQCFRRAAEQLAQNVVIIGADTSRTAPALMFCDKVVEICKINDEDYIPMLLKICEQEMVDLLIPTIDTDLLILSNNKEKFELTGTRVLISKNEKIALCRDKRYTARFFMECGLETPSPIDKIENYQGGYPCFIKPKDGSSSINAYRADTLEELAAYTKQVNDYIIQPFIEGREYTIDILCDFDGEPIYITPRERLAVRSGEVLKTCIVQDHAMIEGSRHIIKKFKPCGPITVQLIREKETGKDYYIEINPRFGGGAPLSMKAGADSAKALLQMCMGEKTEYREAAAKDGMIYSRFDQSICVFPKTGQGRIIKNLLQLLDIYTQYKAIIFDLDDTLYSEKEYVRSGYKVVADLLPEIPDAEQQLWKAFEEGQNAIDVVLKNADIYTEEKKKQCLEAYRTHIPQITMYSEAKMVLDAISDKGLKIGIITDGRPIGQKNKIRQLGLQKYNCEIIITDELAGNARVSDFRKPCPIAFEIMRKRMQCAYSEMVYIGDNVRKDFLAPEQLGMDTVWFQNQEGLKQ